MIAQRVLCPTSATWHGRHYVTDRRWMITTPEGSTITVCSAVCALSWLVYGLPVGAAELQKTSGPAEQRRTPDQEAA